MKCPSCHRILMAGVQCPKCTPKKTMRLIVTERCDRDCTCCCNKAHDMESVPHAVPSMFKGYDQIILTGGEPLLYPNDTLHIIGLIRYVNPKAEIIVYTAKVNEPALLAHVLTKVDGMTITLHTREDVAPFYDCEQIIDILDMNGKKLRLNIGMGVEVTPDAHWRTKNMIWDKDCPVPANETLMRW